MSEWNDAIEAAASIVDALREQALANKDSKAGPIIAAGLDVAARTIRRDLRKERPSGGDK
jgi:hypothetical protein